MHSQQPLGLWFSYVYNLVEPLVTICASVHFLLTFTFIQHYFFSFILFDHSCIFGVCVCLYLCVQVREAMLQCLYSPHCLRLELNGNRKKKRKEAPQPASLHQSWQLLLFHITRSPLVPNFIATHLNPCHHICLHPPANYIASFPQTTLISNDVFSACVGIRNINGG